MEKCKDKTFAQKQNFEEKKWIQLDQRPRRTNVL